MVGCASAFSPAALPSLARGSVARGPQMQAKSASVPFLNKPAKLDGSLVGDVGFDPLGISTLGDMKFLREAEIKHGRVAMLATTGAIVQDLYKFPGVSKVIGDAKMIGAHDKFISEAHAGNQQAFAMHQIIFWVGFLELVTMPALFETLNGGSRAPGDFMFDPLGMGKKDIKSMSLKEIKNGRLAMIGISGIVHHYFITGKGPIELLGK
ncbi:chlorophyll a/b-binding protein domain-containing protein [Baffinella frigidus]|nr:chlorophyll a/b-binding protein domain-containing protein [Cryptophyta sp. CCMP2293]